MTLSVTEAETPTEKPRRRRPPTVMVQVPRCPWCGGSKLQVRKSTDQGDGSRLQYCQCNECKGPVNLVLE